MDWFERLFSGFRKDKQLFWVTYTGSVTRQTPYGKLLLSMHIALAFGALLFLFHTLYYDLRLIRSPNDHEMVRAWKTALWAMIFFTAGTIALGIPITRLAFGAGFMPWPTQA